MQNKPYHLRYLPLFEQDLRETVDYIANTLKNTEAAMSLLAEIEAAILKRAYNPLAFEPFPSKKKRKHPYYRIYVKNYVVYYVVIDDVMEIRRLLHHTRNTDRLLG